MMSRRIWKRSCGLLVTAMVSLAIVLSACGSAGSGSKAAAADTATAESLIAPYVGHPAPFPIDTPLKSKPQGKRVAFMDCNTPTCGLYWEILQPAAKDLGIELVRFNAGVAADSVNTAFNSALESNVDGVYVTSIPASLWKAAATKFKQKNVPVVTAGVIGTNDDVALAMQAEIATKRQGEIIAAYTVAKGGDKTDAVFYQTPELAFVPLMATAFVDEMKKLCPDCNARVVDIPLAQLATGASATIVADLQRHPKTQTAVMGLAPQSYGLAQALKLADIKATTLVNFPDPQALQDIKAGKLEAGVALDSGILGWSLIDSLARLMTHEPVAPGAQKDATPNQILTAKDLQNVDVSGGYHAYSDYQDKFRALWK